MINPYSDHRFQRLKRKSKLKFLLAVILTIPAFIVWLFSLLIPETLTRKLQKHFAFLINPIRGVLDWLKIWLISRPWKKLILALPLIVALCWIFTTLFLAKNLSNEDIYGAYRKDIRGALAIKDYKAADFLGGRLLLSGVYDDDGATLHLVMLAADGNGNYIRRDALVKHLTEDLHYGPTYVWKAQRMLSGKSKGGGVDFQKAIQFIRSAIAVSDDPDPLRQYLGQLYAQVGRTVQAINIFESLPKLDAFHSVLLAELYLRSGDREKAYKVAADTLQSIDIEDPKMSRDVSLRIRALVVFFEVTANDTFVLDYLTRINQHLKELLRLNPSDEKAKKGISQASMLMANIYLKKQNKADRLKALHYLQESISLGVIQPSIGRTVSMASDLFASGGLSVEDMNQALVRGDSSAMAHVFLGLDAWKRKHFDQAVFHFKLAEALEPHSLDVVENVAVYMALASSEGGLNSFSLSLVETPLWRRAIRLLKMSSEIDPSRSDENLWKQSMILSRQQQWGEIVTLLEPRVASASPAYQKKFLRTLIQASLETYDRKKAKEYTNQLKALK